jgi:hypothetical protein
VRSEAAKCEGDLARTIYTPTNTDGTPTATATLSGTTLVQGWHRTMRLAARETRNGEARIATTKKERKSAQSSWNNEWQAKFRKEKQSLTFPGP